MSPKMLTLKGALDEGGARARKTFDHAVAPSPQTDSTVAGLNSRSAGPSSGTAVGKSEQWPRTQPDAVESATLLRPGANAGKLRQIHVRKPFAARPDKPSVLHETCAPPHLPCLAPLPVLSGPL